MRVVQYLDADTRATLAEFTLDGNRVTAKYFDADYRAELEFYGIYTVATGEVRPADGAAFYAALLTAYAASSRMAVVDVEPEPEAVEARAPELNLPGLYADLARLAGWH